MQKVGVVGAFQQTWTDDDMNFHRRSHHFASDVGDVEE